MRKPRKPTRRWIVRRTFYSKLREYAKYELAARQHEWNSTEHDSLALRAHWAYGEAYGVLALAEQLKLIGWTEESRLRMRMLRVMQGVFRAKRARKIEVKP